MATSSLRRKRRRVLTNRKTSNSNWETTVKPIVVLSVISLVVSLLLALVNSMTAPVIAENTKRTTLAASSMSLCLGRY